MDVNRYKEIQESLDSSVMMKLEQVRKFLRRGKASVMVGAGFSKNAVMDEGVRMLDWGELCAGFYRELFGREPSDWDLRLKSALRMAQQVESVKGRNALEELIKDSLPNDAIAPGYLHELLVKLNWRDIFTTNYDTLLEDASVKVCKHYNIVTSKDSLIYQPHPRIVKVHGSFPDNRPFIITEEDYRTYGACFPEFVNTVRQALIETQFVLIGFSGDDPNFLSWLGWFRDIMGSRMLPVYLIQVGAMPHMAEAELMSQRGVQLIPTAACSSDVSEALDFILSYLGDIHTPVYQWAGCLDDRRSFKDISLVEMTSEMRQVRESCPNWLILPVDRINDFNDCWERFPFYGHKFDELTDDRQKIEFLYEMDWRLSTSFTPKWIEDEWYIKALEWAVSVWDTVDNSLRPHVMELALSLLQIYRQTDNSKFHDMLGLLRSKCLPSAFAAHRKLCYESAVWYLQHNDIAKCRECLNVWTVTADDYRGTIWKARLLDETGQGKNAIILLEQSIVSARRKLLSNATSVFHTSALYILEDCLRGAKRQRSEDKNGQFPSFIRYCKFASAEMDKDNGGGYRRVHGFNIGASSRNWQSGVSGYIKKYLGAARYFQMAEDYGRLIGQIHGTYNEDLVKKAAPLLVGISVRAAIPYFVEANSESAVDMAFSRRLMMSWKDNEVDDVKALFDVWFDALNRTDHLTSGQLSYRTLNVIVPVLCRLSVMVDADRAMLLARRLVDLHGSTYHELDKWIATVFNALPLDESRKLFWHIMELPIKLGYHNQDYILPSSVIIEWDGSDKVLENISNALVADNMEQNRAAAERLQQVYLLLPETDLIECDQLIARYWDKLKNTGMPHFLGVNVSDIAAKTWGERLVASINEGYEKFLAIEPVEVHSSSPISDFEECLTLLTNCNPLLTTEQIGSVVRHALKFIAANREQIVKDDSESFFGGMRRFWLSALAMLNSFLASIDGKTLDAGLAADLLGTLNALRREYPFAQAIVNISLAHHNKSKSAKAPEYGLIRGILRDGIRTDDRTLIKDAFKAAVDCFKMTKGEFALQWVADEVVNRLHYIHDDQSVLYLRNLPVWLRNGLVKEMRLKRLARYLKELPQTVKGNDSIPYETKADLLYFGGVAAGCMTPKVDEFIELKQCVEFWREYSANDSVPADIRKGFFFGCTTYGIRK